MVTEKDRMKEWLRRNANEINSLKKDANLGPMDKLHFIRQSYSIINVLTMVAENKAFMLGIAPLDSITKE